MKERPILFSAPMIRALLAGKKTQTRRVARRDTAAPVEESYEHWQDATWGSCATDGTSSIIHCPYGATGDRLWVRETWADLSATGARPEVAYRASCDGDDMDVVVGDVIQRIGIARWRPSIFMPRWASRLTLEVTGVRVERLQDISEADARAEGVETFTGRPTDHRYAFGRLWDAINVERAPWSSNPWVWVVEFRRVTP